MEEIILIHVCPLIVLIVKTVHTSYQLILAAHQKIRLQNVKSLVVRSGGYYWENGLCLMMKY